MCFTTIYNPNTNVFPFPHWTWPEHPSLIFEGLKSPMSVTPCPAHSDVPHSPPLLSPITCQSTWHPELQLLTEDINYLAQHWAQLHEDWMRKRDMKQGQSLYSNPIHLLTHCHNNVQRKGKEKDVSSAAQDSALALKTKASLWENSHLPWHRLQNLGAS